MKRMSMMVLAMAMAAVVASPVLAKGHKKHVVSCEQIRDAIAAGKTPDEVRKELKVSKKKVKNCTKTSAPKTKK